MTDKPTHRGSKRARRNAKSLRRDMTAPERLLWYFLRNRQLAHLKVRRQQVVGPYIVDFYCAEADLVVEVDGESHIGQVERDDARDASLRSHGVCVLRVANDDVLQDPYAVARCRPPRLSRKPSPLPSPLERERG